TTMSRPKLLVVVQRYGDGVAGGAETHARELTKRLAPHLDVEVLTTAAQDYRTWENAFTAGIEWVDDVPVRRFPVMRPRAWDFKLYERRAYTTPHTLEDERTFVDQQGPYAPDLLEHLWRNGRDADHFLFFTYIYYPTVRGLPLVPERAVLVPTAHDDPALDLAIYDPVVHVPRGTPFKREEDQYDALEASVALAVPEVLSSMSMATLEAWSCGRPVICDAESHVVWGMTRRARGGLAYKSAAEFGEIVAMLTDDRGLRDRLGESGRAFVERTYRWPRIIETYLDLFAEVRSRNA